MDISNPQTPPPKSLSFSGIWLFLLGLVLGGGGVYAWQTGLINLPVDQPKACTMEAKLCPDGTSVGRTGPNCEFAACPSINLSPALVPSVSPTATVSSKPQILVPSNWKTYVVPIIVQLPWLYQDQIIPMNMSYSFKYPQDFEIKFTGEGMGEDELTIISRNYKMSDGTKEPPQLIDGLEASISLYQPEKIDEGPITEMKDTININGISAKKYLYEEKDLASIRYAIPIPNYPNFYMYTIVSISGPKTKEYINLFEQILSTFRFD
jgi:hypothetical protein